MAAAAPATAALSSDRPSIGSALDSALSQKNGDGLLAGIMSTIGTTRTARLRGPTRVSPSGTEIVSQRVV